MSVQPPIFPEGMSEDRLLANLEAAVQLWEEFANKARARFIETWLSGSALGCSPPSKRYVVTGRGLGWAEVTMTNDNSTRKIEAPVPCI